MTRLVRRVYDVYHLTIYARVSTRSATNDSRDIHTYTAADSAKQTTNRTVVLGIKPNAQITYKITNVKKQPCLAGNLFDNIVKKTAYAGDMDTTDDCDVPACSHVLVVYCETNEICYQWNRYCLAGLRLMYVSFIDSSSCFLTSVNFSPLTLTTRLSR